MIDRRLPLDGIYHQAYVGALRELVEADPGIPDAEAARAFVREHRDLFGPRTIEATLGSSPDQLRVLMHVMVLACSELADLHEASREWLAGGGHALPPWDVAAPVTRQRLIRFGGRVCGVVAWEPEPSVELASVLDDAERRWATALAIAIGERPQWSDDEVCRYAAYLVMGTEEFAAQRECSDEELSARHGVPVAAVVYRRGLPDAV